MTDQHPPRIKAPATSAGATVHVMVEQVEQVPFELYYLRVIPILPIGLTTESVRRTSTSLFEKISGSRSPVEDPNNL
jgi:hypothetical protein